jgi:hypothetical protein
VTWPIIFLALVLKIPILWIGWVIWRAIKAVPDPMDGVGETGVDPGQGSGGGRRPLRPSPFRRGPHGSPDRRYARRSPAGAPSRAEFEADR